METYISKFPLFIQKEWEKQNFKKATNIQLKVVEPILARKDVIATSPTGTGKTLAYLLPLLHNLKETNDNVQVVILASSHELVMQIVDVIQAWTKESNLRSAAFIGGANIKRQIERLKKRPQIIVGTPGRIYELIKMKKLKMHNVETIVLDEGDQLLLPEHIDTIQLIVKSALTNCQLLLFSATIPEKIEEKAKAMMNAPEIIRIKTSDANAAVQHTYIVSEARKKIDVIRRLGNMKNMKGIVFGKDIGNLAVLAEKLQYKGLQVAILHSETSKQQRQQAINLFKNGKCPLLLATDVAARGLDIQNVSHVIHLDVPNEVNQYLHRSGRTGRLGQTSGTVISIVAPSEIKKLKQLIKEANLSLLEVEIYKGEIQKKKEEKDRKKTYKQTNAKQRQYKKAKS